MWTINPPSPRAHSIGCAPKPAPNSIRDNLLFYKVFLKPIGCTPSPILLARGTTISRCASHGCPDRTKRSTQSRVRRGAESTGDDCASRRRWILISLKVRIGPRDSNGHLLQPAWRAVARVCAASSTNRSVADHPRTFAWKRLVTVGGAQGCATTAAARGRAAAASRWMLQTRVVA